jgi:hypothetical protein
MRRVECFGRRKSLRAVPAASDQGSSQVSTESSWPAKCFCASTRPMSPNRLRRISRRCCLSIYLAVTCLRHFQI